MGSLPIETPKELILESQDAVSIQVASDLHLEFYGSFDQIPSDIIIPKAPILALLGDIGLACTEILRSFLLQQADRFEHVLFLAGNHEYYNHGNKQHTVSEQMEWMQNVCSQRDNLHFLEKGCYQVNGVVILATTLWSYIPNSIATQAERSMNDYHIGYTAKDTQMRVHDTNHEFHQSLQWMEDQIDSHKDKPIVVLTHHTPLMKGTSHPQYDGSDLSHGFSTDLPELLQPPVVVWVCGHTHYNFDFFSENGTRVVSNQRGYPGKGTVGYNNAFVLDMSSHTCS